MPEMNGWMKAKLKRQLEVLQENEFRSLSQTTDCLCPLGQNTSSFQFANSTTPSPIAGPMHLPEMLFPLPPRIHAPFSFRFQISHPFNREGFLLMQSAPLLYYPPCTRHLSCVILTEIKLYIYFCDCSFSNRFLQQTESFKGWNHVCFLFTNHPGPKVQCLTHKIEAC